MAQWVVCKNAASMGVSLNPCNDHNATVHNCSFANSWFDSLLLLTGQDTRGERDSHLMQATRTTY